MNPLNSGMRSGSLNYVPRQEDQAQPSATNDSFPIEQALARITDSAPQALAYHHISFIQDAMPYDPNRTNAELRSIPNTIKELKTHYKFNLTKLLQLDSKIFRAKADRSQATPYLETQQIEALKLWDSKIDAMELESLREAPINTKIRCLTWITDQTGEVWPPFSTCILRKRMHLMMYDSQSTRIDFKDAKVSVVTGDYLCEIPFQMDIQRNQPWKIFIAAMPQAIKIPNRADPTSSRVTWEITGVKVFLFGEQS